MGDPVKFDPWAMLAELRGLSLLQLQQGRHSISSGMGGVERSLGGTLQGQSLPTNGEKEMVKWPR
jgi:hypothetical protein